MVLATSNVMQDENNYQYDLVGTSNKNSLYNHGSILFKYLKNQYEIKRTSSGIIAYIGENNNLGCIEAVHLPK